MASIEAEDNIRWLPVHAMLGGEAGHARHVLTNLEQMEGDISNALLFGDKETFVGLVEHYRRVGNLVAKYTSFEDTMIDDIEPW